MPCKILFSNVGYAKGIDGSLLQHVMGIGRHFYASQAVQKKSLQQLRDIILNEDPDVCCFVEVDQGSLHSGYYNQLSGLIDERYTYYDITGKYGDESRLSRALFHHGKSNGFVSKHNLEFEKLYFKYGTKRLIYKIRLKEGISLFFAHFSLEWKVRQKQMFEIRELMAVCDEPVILLADFNIMRGFSELKPLLSGAEYTVLNKENEPTFIFHTKKLTLDLCICSASLAEHIRLRIIPQPFSDHSALLIEF